MWGFFSSIVFLIFLIVAFGGGEAVLKHRREMMKLKIEQLKAQSEVSREQRLLLEAQKESTGSVRE